MATSILIATAFIALALARNVPSPLRVRRARSASGLSPSSAGLIIGSSVAWTVYAAWESAWEGAASSTVVIVVLMWWAVEMVRFGSSWRRITVAATASLAVIAAVVTASIAVGAGTMPLAVLVVLSGLAFGLPRLVVGMRSPSLAGVSALYLSLNLADALVFGAYGVVIGMWGFPAHAITQVVTSPPVLLRWFARPDLQHTAKHPASGVDSVGHSGG